MNALILLKALDRLNVVAPPATTCQLALACCIGSLQRKLSLRDAYWVRPRTGLHVCHRAHHMGPGTRTHACHGRTDASWPCLPVCHVGSTEGF